MYQDLLALRHVLCVVALMALAVVVILHHQQVLRRRVTTWLVAGLCAFGLWQYPIFGSLHDGQLLHPNEFAHYYFGGKYFNELGYRDFYVGMAIGLDEAGIRIDRVRNLEHVGGYVSRAEFLQQASRIKARFSSARWDEFVSDLRALHDKAHGYTYEAALLDAGFNGTPAWVLFSRLFTWISPAHAYVITSVDVLLVAAAVCLLGAAFGWTEALMGLALFLFFPSGSFSTFDWTAGSVLRMLWVFWLSLALVCYKKNRPFLAGCAFAVATLDRLFPGGFAAAAVVVSAAAAWKVARGRLDSPPWRFVALLVAGGVVATAVGTIVPQLLWPGSWLRFSSDIVEHGRYLFTNHFGWSKVAAFYPQQGEIAFSNQMPQIFADWGALMFERTSWPFFVASAFLVWSAIWIFGPIRLPAETAICVMGLSLIFFKALPAHYYLTMLLPIGVTFTNPKLPLPIVVAFWMLWVLCSVVTILPENLGWGLVSLLMMALFCWLAVFLAFSPAHSAAFRAGVAGAVTAIVFMAHAWVAWPQQAATPPAGESTAVPVQLAYRTVVPLITRTFPDRSAHLVTDTGGVVTADVSPAFANPFVHAAWICKVIVRTDRFFPGTLELWSGDVKLQSWPVEGRGWIFDDLMGNVPCLPQYSFRWNGANNIALFQTWIEPLP